VLGRMRRLMLLRMLLVVWRRHRVVVWIARLAHVLLFVATVLPNQVNGPRKLQ
jgi:hypothetical protein